MTLSCTTRQSGAAEVTLWRVWEDRCMTQSSPAGLSTEALVIGILGGTGDQGRGLARRLAMAGQSVIIGSRDAARAAPAASDLGGGRLLAGGRYPPPPPARPAGGSPAPG